MGFSKRFVQFGCALFLLAAAAPAQTFITDVVNAGNRIPSGFPSYGIAQGALFAVTGFGLGPDQLLQASFPLPTTDGLGGVTVQVAVGGSTVNAIMVYVSSKDVGAILPSSTPLGAGTVTVNNNGTTVSAPITVVAAAFGAFSLDYYSGTQQALAFNVGGDGGSSVNYLAPFSSAQPGQDVLISGTGLGKIASDETQSGATDVPSVDIKVWVGTKPAAVVSAGRGAAPSLPDNFPVYPVPSGIAAWDVIRFTVPDGVTGCHVPVIVQIGNFVSNAAWITVSADGGPCVDVNTADFGDTVSFTDKGRIGNISLTRVLIKSSTGGVTTEIGSESGASTFLQFSVPAPVTVPVSVYAYAAVANNLNPGTCLIQTFRSVRGAPTPPQPPRPPADPPLILDAGPAINLKGPASPGYQLKKQTGGSYGGGLGSSFTLPGIPGTNTLFLNPGAFTADNGGGGADIPSFTGTVSLPNPGLTFDNSDQLGASLDRTKGVTVKWSGGDPNSYVSIVGVSTNVTGNVTLSGNFTCTERISAGQFTVPPYVTLAMPATKSDPPLPPIGALGLWAYAIHRIDVPTLDFAFFSIVLDTQTTILYQ